VKSAAVVLLLVGCGDDSAHPAIDAAPQTDGGDSWHTGTPLPEARTEVFAIAAGGKIYVLGGIPSTGGGSSHVDIWDGSAWSAGPALPFEGHHLAVAVVSDKIYLLGGYEGANFAPRADTWVLDTAWTQLADQPIARGAATAQAIGGIIYVAGGSSGGAALPDLYAYDSAANTWAQKPIMLTPREHLASCVLGGKFITIGGRDPITSNKNAVEAYDPAANAWSALAPMPTARGGLAATVASGVCYVVGGERWDTNTEPTTYDNNESFDGNAWTTQSPLPTRRHGLGAATLNGQVYVIAGGPMHGFTYSNVVEIFTP
jgi:N-acetylneuraminic acid mutarotase